MIFPKVLPRKFLGIDIGSASIKLVELSAWGERKKLENYGEIKTEAVQEKSFRTFKKKSLLLSNQEIAQAIKAIREEAKIKTRESFFSLPDFSSFFTNLELPSMTKEELPQAVFYEARQHVPLPLGEVTLDWKVIGGEVSGREKTRLKILLVAVPNEVINQYQEITRLCNLKLLALEAEAFSLARALIQADEEKITSIIDIGAHSTTCSIIDKRVLKVSHSFDFSGDILTERIAKSLSIDYQTAEKLKEEYGIVDTSLSSSDVVSLSGKKVKEILLPLFDVALNEIEKISQNFYQREGKEVQKFILAGGLSLTPGLREYFANYLKKETEIANPFSDIIYPPILEETLKEMGPSFAIASGVALRGFK